MLAGVAAADYDGTAVETPFAHPAAHDAVQEEPRAVEREQPDGVEAREPEARIHAAELREERERDDHEEHDRPRDGEACALAHRIAERVDLVDVGGLERDHRQGRDAERGRDVVPVEDAVGRVDVTEIGRKTR
jgi:MoxR-like ATPase